MKKIIAILILLFSAVLLVSCGDNKTFKFEITGETDLRTSAVFKYTFSDEDKQLENSDINYKVYVKGEDSTTRTGTVSKPSSDEEKELTITSLAEKTTYVLKITSAFEGKEIDIISPREFQTTDKGISEENPYLVSNADEFLTMLPNDAEGYYKLTADIDLEGKTVEPIFRTTYFTGTFDGDGHKIKNFKLGTDSTNHTYSTTYCGLFGSVDIEGTLKNFTIEDASLNVYRSSSTYFSLVCGYCAGVVENVKVLNSTLKVNGSASTQYAAMIVGKLVKSAKVKNCEVSNSTLTVESRHSVNVGGIVAINDTRDTRVTSEQNEITGSKFSGTINVSISTTSAISSALSVKVGGIVGQNCSYVANCVNDSNIKVSTSVPYSVSTDFTVFVGGITGQNAVNGSSILYNNESSSTFEVTSKEATSVYVGLITGLNGGKSATSANTVILNNSAKEKEGTNTVNVRNDLYLGLVGLDKAANTTYSANYNADFTINTFRKIDSTQSYKIQKVKVEKEAHSDKPYIVYEETEDENIDPVTYKLSLEAEALKGNLTCVAPESLNLNAIKKGTTVTLKVTCVAEYEIDKILIDEVADETILVNENGEFELTITKDTKVSVTFKEAEVH